MSEKKYLKGGPRRRQQQFLEERYPMHAEEGQELQIDVKSADRRLAALRIYRERKALEIKKHRENASSSDISSPQNDY